MEQESTRQHAAVNKWLFKCLNCMKDGFTRVQSLIINTILVTMSTKQIFSAVFETICSKSICHICCGVERWCTKLVLRSLSHTRLYYDARRHYRSLRLLTDSLLRLTGNKIDLADKREVLRQRAEDFADSQSMLYLETSAKESDNVEKLFLDLACELIREAKQNKLDNSDTAPMPGEGKSINYLSCCSLN